LAGRQLTGASVSLIGACDRAVSARSGQRQNLSAPEIVLSGFNRITKCSITQVVGMESPHFGLKPMATQSKDAGRVMGSSAMKSPPGVRVNSVFFRRAKSKESNTAGLRVAATRAPRRARPTGGLSAPLRRFRASA
jgi:hypothetical protein